MGETFHQFVLLVFIILCVYIVFWCMIMVKYIIHSAIFVGHCVLNLHFLIINEAECFFLFLSAIWIFLLLKGSIQWYSTCIVLVRTQVKRKEGSERVREERESYYHILFFFSWFWGLNPGHCKCQANALLLSCIPNLALVIFICCLALFY